MGQKSPNLTKLKIFDYLKMLPSYDIPNNFLVPRMNESESKPYSYMRSATQQLTKKKIRREENTSDAYLFDFSISSE